MAIVLKSENIAQFVFFVRGEKVMLAADLARLYRVPTKSLNLAVKRNATRFPADFMFQLTDDEVAGLRFHFETSKPAGARGGSPLRSQFVTSNTGRGGRRYRPYAFTEQGGSDAFERAAQLARRRSKYGVRGRRRIDCIARLGNGRADREIASQSLIG